MHIRYFTDITIIILFIITKLGCRVESDEMFETLQMKSISNL